MQLNSCCKKPKLQEVANVLNNSFTQEFGTCVFFKNFLLQNIFELEMISQGKLLKIVSLPYSSDFNHFPEDGERKVGVAENLKQIAVLFEGIEITAE